MACADALPSMDELAFRTSAALFLQGPTPLKVGDLLTLHRERCASRTGSQGPRASPAGFDCRRAETEASQGRHTRQRRGRLSAGGQAGRALRGPGVRRRQQRGQQEQQPDRGGDPRGVGGRGRGRARGQAAAALLAARAARRRVRPAAGPRGPGAHAAAARPAVDGGGARLVSRGPSFPAKPPWAPHAPWWPIDTAAQTQQRHGASPGEAAARPRRASPASSPSPSPLPARPNQCLTVPLHGLASNPSSFRQCPSFRSHARHGPHCPGPRRCPVRQHEGPRRNFVATPNSNRLLAIPGPCMP
jgi:hypothetical protein